MFDLTGKVALVTGASGGIGEAVACALHAQGAKVVLHGTRAEKLELLQQKLGDRAFRLAVDLCDRDKVAGLIEAATALAGPVSILVNNAGHNITESFEDISEESFDRMIDVHVKGTFFMTQSAYRDMKRRGQGRIINITSQLAYKGAPKMAHYCAAKGANTTFTRALALECGDTGVLVNAVAPGVTHTDLLTPLADEVLDTLKAAIPLNRFAEVDEIAPAVALLASTAGSFFHGSCISPNGGEVMF